MGEEFVRRIMVLGSVPSLGPVILFDDIEGLFKWNGAGTDVLYTVAKDSTVAYNDSASLKIKTDTGSPAEDDYVDATRFCFERPGRRCRIELLFMLTAYQNSKLTRFRFESDDLSSFITAEVVYQAATRQWYYLNSVGGLSLIPGSAFTLGDLRWHRLLFEFDMAAGRYLWFECDNFKFDMSALALYSQVSGEVSYSKIGFKLVAAGVNPPEMHVDDVLVMEI
jgi:hypothetical protein